MNEVTCVLLKEYRVEELFDQLKGLPSEESVPSVSEDKKVQALRVANAKLRYQILHLRKVTSANGDGARV